MRALALHTLSDQDLLSRLSSRPRVAIRYLTIFRWRDAANETSVDPIW